MRKKFIYGLCGVMTAVLVLAGCNNTEKANEVTPTTVESSKDVEDVEVKDNTSEDISNPTEEKEIVNEEISTENGTEDSLQNGENSATDTENSSNDDTSDGTAEGNTQNDGTTEDGVLGEDSELTDSNESDVNVDIVGDETEDDIPLTEKEIKKLRNERARYYYADIVSYIFSTNSVPSMDQIGPDYSSFGYYDNLGDIDYYITDVTGDGEEELLIRYTGATLYWFDSVYKFYEDTNSVVRIYDGISNTFYENGYIIDQSSYRDADGGFPSYLYKYDAEKKEYIYVATISYYDLKEMYGWGAESYFPSDKDKNGDGVVYYISTEEKERYFDNNKKKENYVNELIENNEEIVTDWYDSGYFYFNSYYKSVNYAVDESYIKTILKVTDKRADVDSYDMGAEYLRGTFGIYNELGISDENLTYTEETAEGEEEYYYYYEKRFEYNNVEALTFSADDYGFDVDYYSAIPDLYICGVAPGMSASKAVKKLNMFGFYTNEDITDDYNGTAYLYIGTRITANTSHMAVTLKVENGIVTNIGFGVQYYILAG